MGGNGKLSGPESFRLLVFPPFTSTRLWLVHARLHVLPKHRKYFTEAYMRTNQRRDAEIDAAGTCALLSRADGSMWILQGSTGWDKSCAPRYKDGSISYEGYDVIS